jgi:diguanylate cyclase (GGDEF)-like protein
VLVGAASPYPFWPSERRAEILAAQKRIVDQGSGELELMLVRDNGERFPASVVTARAAEQDGPPAFVSTIRDISERKRQQDELERQATHDGLTGVLNRAAFTERMEREIASARAAGQPLSLALVDLDHFKAINDRHGHPVGDRVLAETAARLRAAGRAGDHLGRVGGEEFAWLFPGADADAAFLAAERARRAVEAAVVAGYDGVTLSIGVCTLSDATDGEDLYRLADAALYRAKALGRNQCAVHGA